MKKVMLLFGGKSPEHNVSLQSAECIIRNIDRKKYHLIIIYIDRLGNWYICNKDSNLHKLKHRDLKSVSNIIELLKSVDIAFPMIHGTYGEDGRLQSLFELFSIPYVGCSSKTSMICMDKEYTKILAEKNNIPIVPYKTITSSNIKEIVNYPVIVKPANGGSSIGIGIAHNEKELRRLYKEALKFDTKVIVEKYINARELEVGVLINKKKKIKSPIGEIIKEGEYYSYDKKYINSYKTSNSVELPKNIDKAIFKLVDIICDLFNIEGLARIDFFYEEENNRIYFNEINTIPGFTDISMYPKLFMKKGLAYKRLLTNIIEFSIKENKKSS